MGFLEQEVKNKYDVKENLAGRLWDVSEVRIGMSGAWGDLDRDPMTYVSDKSFGFCAVEEGVNFFSISSLGLAATAIVKSYLGIVVA